MSILISNDFIRQEYERWLKYFGNEDPYHGEDTVGLLDVLRAHFLIADYFYAQEYGLGGIGPRDADLLHSAVYRQFVSFGGRDKWHDSFEKAATLVFGIVKDHPFHDANKRTGLLILLFFLHKMNRFPMVGQQELEDFVVQIAESQLDKYPRYRELSKKREDADVIFISDYLKRNSRRRDNKYYTITYQELDKRLREFGFQLSNPSGNYIDIVKIQERRRIFGLGRKEPSVTKIAQIGFPGWKSQVGKGAIATVRKEARLTTKDGVDSATFYHGADPLHSLIDQYAVPLQRLAYR